MMFFPKVTMDYKEFQKLTREREYPKDSCRGLYDGESKVIWLRNKDILTLTHELLHHFAWVPFEMKFASTRLFMDFIDTLQEALYHWLRYPQCRKKKIKKIMWMEIARDFNHWLDWVLCR